MDSEEIRQITILNGVCVYVWGWGAATTIWYGDAINFLDSCFDGIFMEAFNNKKILKKTVQSKREGCGSVFN